MVLSQTAEYALRAVLFLARDGRGRPVTADAIAGALAAPSNYLAKTLNQLAKAGIVAGMRGPTGGFVLLRDPSKLTVADVVGTFDEPAAQPMCVLGGRRCNAAFPCEAHTRWSRLMGSMREPLRTTTVSDLLSEVVELREAV